MDNSYYYEKFYLGRRLLALILCAIFLFPYFYYNTPLFNYIPSDTSFYSLSEDADFSFITNNKRKDIVLKGHLKQGELQLSPNLSSTKSYQFIITTDNAVISAKNAVLSILYYQGNDGIYYTHVVCKKGHAVLSLYNEEISKVSTCSKYLSSNFEAIIYEDEGQIGFVRFESDGSNPRPGHGVYSRKVKTENGLYEYLEIDPLYYSVFKSTGEYKAPSWDYSLDLGLTGETEDTETNDSRTSTNPSDFCLCLSVMYFSKYIPWGEEDTILSDDKMFESESTNPENTNTFGLTYESRSIVVNDDLETLGSESPLYLDTLTLYENFPSHTVLINGPVFVKSLVLISASGKDDSHLIKKDPKNRVFPISNYFKTSKEGYIIFSVIL